MDVSMLFSCALVSWIGQSTDSAPAINHVHTKVRTALSVTTVLQEPGLYLVSVRLPQISWHKDYLPSQLAMNEILDH